MMTMRSRPSEFFEKQAGRDPDRAPNVALPTTTREASIEPTPSRLAQQVERLGAQIST